MNNQSDSYWGGLIQRLFGYIPLFLFFLLLSLCVEVRYFVGAGHIFTGEIVYSTISLLLWSTLPTLIIALLPGKYLRGFATGLFAVVYTLIYFFEHFLIYSYSAFYTDSIAVNIMATNPNEASSFLSNIRLSSFLWPLIYYVVALIVSRIIGRHLKRGSYPRLLSLTYAIGVILLLPIATVTTFPAQNKTWSYNYMAPIERIGRGTYRCIEDAKSLENYIKDVKDIDLGDVKRSKDFSNANIILIMGESMSRYYMHCYGYPLENTPHTDSLARIGDLILFTDVIAPAPSTAGSISESMSFYSHESEGKKSWYEFPTLNTVLSRAGYYTYWLSNQEKQGAGIQPVATIAMTADSTKFAKVRTYGDWNSVDDEQLLPLLMDRRNIPTNKDSFFSVIHIMGSHTPFASRFTPAFAKFTEKDIPERSPFGTPTPKGEEQRKNLAAYVNSIYYNDYVINQIYKHYAGSPTMVIYLSDHAQSLYETADRPDYYEHEASKPGLSIPLMVYFTPEMRAQYPELYEQVQSAKDRRIMTDLLANSVSGLLGIQHKYYQPKLDFFSPEYDNTRHRTVSVYGGKHIEL